jgi:hypothetical protein
MKNKKVGVPEQPVWKRSFGKAKQGIVKGRKKPGKGVVFQCVFNNVESSAFIDDLFAVMVKHNIRRFFNGNIRQSNGVCYMSDIIVDGYIKPEELIKTGRLKTFIYKMSEGNSQGFQKTQSPCEQNEKAI